jgi:hypothetical protein
VEAAQPEASSLNDSGDEDGESSDKDGRGLIFDRLQLLCVHGPVNECVERGDEAKEILSIDCDTDTNAGDVWIRRYSAGIHGAEWGEIAESQQRQSTFINL